MKENNHITQSEVNKMGTFEFEYVHNHGDTTWDKWVNPIIDNLQVEAESEEHAIEIAENELLNQLEKQSDSDDELMMKLAYTSPFNENSLAVY